MSRWTNTDAAVQDPSAWNETAVPGRYRHDWLLFLDWCAATDRVAMPADPDTVIGFLDAHPATRATNRRRLTAIRWIHQHAGRYAPHRTRELHGRTLPTPQSRIDVDTIRPLLEEMPTSAWTAGLVGRRDALLLILAAHDVPYTAVEHLHRRDAVVDDNRCLVVTLPTAMVRIPAVPADPRRAGGSPPRRRIPARAPSRRISAGLACWPTTTSIRPRSRSPRH